MKRIFSILLALALVLAFSLVATAPVAAVTPDWVPTVMAAAKRLASVQNSDGGFPWTLPSTTSYTNVLGITAMGILKAWELTDWGGYEQPLAKAYKYCLEKPPAYTWDGTKYKETTAGVDSFPDITFLVSLSRAAAADASLLAAIQSLFSYEIVAAQIAALAKSRWDNRVLYLGATQGKPLNGTATSLAQYIRDSRHSQGWDTLIPWDLEAGVKAAQVLDDYYPGQGYDQQAIDIAEVIYDSIDDAGDIYFDSTDTSQEDYIAGLTGGIEAFREVSLHLDKAAELVALLLAEQQSGGYWDYHGASPVDKSVQNTAYAIMALQGYSTQAVNASWEAAAWLISSQEVLGGWYAEGGTGTEIAEIDSEAAWALARFRTEKEGTATGTGDAFFTPGAGVIEDLTDVATPAGAPTVFPHGMFTFKITGLSDYEEVTLTIELPDPVPVGTKWWKYHNNTWSPMDIGDDDGDNTITVALKDDRTPDDEDQTLGQITDQGGPGSPGAVGWETHPVSKVRVLLPWIALFAAIVAGVSLLVVRRRRAQS